MIESIDKAILRLKDCGLKESEIEIIVSDSFWPEIKRFCKCYFGTWRYGKILIKTGLNSDDPKVHFIVMKRIEKSGAIAYKNGKIVFYTDVWQK